VQYTKHCITVHQQRVSSPHSKSNAKVIEILKKYLPLLYMYRLLRKHSHLSSRELTQAKHRLIRQFAGLLFKLSNVTSSYRVAGELGKLCVRKYNIS